MGYPALKRKTLPQPPRWPSPEDTEPSDISQSQKDTHCVTPPTPGVKQSDARAASRSGVRVGGVGEQGAGTR